MRITEDTLKGIVADVIMEFLNATHGGTHATMITEMLTTAISPKRLGQWIEKVFHLHQKCEFISYNAYPNMDSYATLQAFVAHKALNNKGIESAAYFKIIAKGSFGDVTFEDIQEVIEWLNAHGWYFAGCFRKTQEGRMEPLGELTNSIIDSANEHHYWIELIFRNIIGEKEDNISDYCYHVTPTIELRKILSQGLIPKHLARVEMHPERVYLYTEYPEQYIHEIIDNFMESEKTQGRRENGYTVLKVRMVELKDKIPFYKDDNHSPYGEGIYTTEPISLEYIEIFKQIE